MVSPVIVITALTGTNNERGQSSEDSYGYYLRSWISNNSIPDSRPTWSLLDVPVTASPNILLATSTSEVENMVLRASEPVSVQMRDRDTESANRYVCSYPWLQGCAYALAVIGCESSFDEGADRNWPYIGWWQIDVQLHAELITSLGYTTADMYSGEPNTDIAWHLSSSGINMSPWPSCRWQ